MSLFSSLIPGLREVRAPLLAGYIWLTSAWLLLEPHVPSADSDSTYERLVELGEAIGPVGLGFAASIAAYLIGSLVHSALRLLWRVATRGLGPLRIDEDQQQRFEDLAMEDQPQPIGTILQIADPFQEAELKRPFLSDASLSVTIWELADRELMESFRKLQLVVRAIHKRVSGAPVCSFGMHGRTPVVHLAVSREESAEEQFVIPHLMPSRDLLSEISLLQTRLLEVAETTGAEIERHQAEAEFRFTIAVPLVILFLILVFSVSPLWLIALVFPVALVIQGNELSQRAAEEVLDALRARTQTPELEQITPIFARYRSQTTELLQGLREAEWPHRIADAALRTRTD